MKVLPILQSPNKVLIRKAKPVKKITPKVLKLINDMKHTLVGQDNPKGVGLAAPQVGESIQLFILREAENSPVRVFINPKVTLKETQVLTDEPDINPMEGCLSIHGLWGIIDRAKVIDITYLDEKGEPHTEEIRGFLAQIIQHEYDHIKGILFPVRVLESTGRLYRDEKDDGNFIPIGENFNI